MCVLEGIWLLASSIWMRKSLTFVFIDHLRVKVFISAHEHTDTLTHRATHSHTQPHTHTFSWVGFIYFYYTSSGSAYLLNIKLCIWISFCHLWLFIFALRALCILIFVSLILFYKPTGRILYRERERKGEGGRASQYLSMYFSSSCQRTYRNRKSTRVAKFAES